MKPPKRRALPDWRTPPAPVGKYLIAEEKSKKSEGKRKKGLDNGSYKLYYVN